MKCSMYKKEKEVFDPFNACLCMHGKTDIKASSNKCIKRYIKIVNKKSKQGSHSFGKSPIIETLPAIIF